MSDTLRQKIINIAAEAVNDKTLSYWITVTDKIAVAVLPQHKKKLKSFAYKLGGCKIYQYKNLLFYVYLMREDLENTSLVGNKELTLNGCMINIPSTFEDISTHQIDEYFFLHIRDSKHLSITKTTITL
jgi:hypothetical protein